MTSMRVLLQTLWIISDKEIVMAVQSLKSLFPKLIANYGDDVARGVATYGDDLAEGLVKYGDDASDWAKGVIKRPRTGVRSGWFTVDSAFDLPTTKYIQGFPIDYRSYPYGFEDTIQLQPYTFKPIYARSSKGGSGESLKELMPKLFKNVSDDDLPF